MKVQWRVAVCCAVMFIGWISAEEINKRKLIIRVPHVHRKHPSRPPPKPHSSHGKGNSKPGDHIHKHHHHFHDDDYGESSHAHEYEDHGHHHGHHHPHHRSPSHHHHHHPHHHHSGHHHHSSHRHHSSPNHYHSDHHGHGSHHVTHHRHPDHHDDEYVHRYRSEDNKYEDHYPDHSHHHYRPHHYVEDDDEEYDCMEVCEKCKMKSYHRRHRGRLSRGHDTLRSESESRPSLPHPQLTVANFKASSSPVRGNYDVRGKEDFKASLATGELRETHSAYGANKYGGYVLPTAIEQAVASNAGKVITANGPVRHGEHPNEFDVSFPTFQSSDFLPSGGWQNNSYLYGKFQNPGQNIIGYNQQHEQIQHTRYVEEGTHVENKNNDARGGDLRYLNRYKYDTNR